jgi:hypothetical protein
MDVAGWCGSCGESFRLLEVVEDGNAANCPRCGTPFAPAYAAVVAQAVRQLAAGAAAVAAAGRQLRDVAPGLHIDRTKLGADLDRALTD